MAQHKYSEDLAELLYRPLTVKTERVGDTAMTQTLERAGEILCKWVLDTRDAQVRTTLIAMGWIPPDRKLDSQYPYPIPPVDATKPKPETRKRHPVGS